MQQCIKVNKSQKAPKKKAKRSGSKERPVSAHPTAGKSKGKKNVKTSKKEKVKMKKLIAEAEAYRSEVVNRAAGDASRFDQVYQAYKVNPDVTKERIYIETVEEIFSNVEKIIIDEPAGGSGVVPYLPLRELNKPSGGN